VATIVLSQVDFDRYGDKNWYGQLLIVTTILASSVPAGPINVADCKGLCSRQEFPREDYLAI